MTNGDTATPSPERFRRPDHLRRLDHLSGGPAAANRRRSGVVALAVLVTLGSGLVVVGLAGPARACSCLESTEAESFERAEVVFVGTVLEVVSLDDGVVGTALVRLSVSRPLKGPVAAGPVDLTTTGNSAACGYPFQEGGEYLVMASFRDDQLRTGLCSGTRLASTSPVTVPGGAPPARPTEPRPIDLTG